MSVIYVTESNKQNKCLSLDIVLLLNTYYYKSSSSTDNTYSQVTGYMFQHTTNFLISHGTMNFSPRGWMLNTVDVETIAVAIAKYN